MPAALAILIYLGTYLPGNLGRGNPKDAGSVGALEGVVKTTIHCSFHQVYRYPGTVRGDYLNKPTRASPQGLASVTLEADLLNV